MTTWSKAGQTALLQAQRAVKVQDRSTPNAFGKYNYASSEDMILAGRGYLNDAGLALSVWKTELEVLGTGPFIAKVRMTFELSHPESGEWKTFEAEQMAIEGKGRPADKAVAASESFVWLYVMRDLLMIPRKEEGEVDARDDRDSRPANPARMTGADRNGNGETLTEAEGLALIPKSKTREEHRAVIDRLRASGLKTPALLDAVSKKSQELAQ